ncbi:hypothetical protein [Streptomyces sp. NPDC088847]|uniref:hypothetical protein n=1 Tax=Streptomyces sp. NPDC088847 TaxID=3365909 RepID=UPI00382E3F6C
MFVHADGSVAARLPVEEMSDSGDDIEIAREDLVHTLAVALPASADIIFGDSVDALTDDGHGVDVHFVSGRAERLDLVLGADGLHSVTRRLTFGPERDYLRHLGLYVALAEARAAFAGHTEWKIPQLLDAVRADPDFYFDSVSLIHMPTWQRGRIALVGDAAHCAALLPRGTGTGNHRGEPRVDREERCGPTCAAVEAAGNTPRAVRAFASPSWR